MLVVDCIVQSLVLCCQAADCGPSCLSVCRLDATLKELTSLVKEVNIEARQKGTFFDFAIIFPDSRSPSYRMREIGSTCSGRKGQDDTVTLASKDFEIGDYLDIAITPPRGLPGGGMALARVRGRPF